VFGGVSLTGPELDVVSWGPLGAVTGDSPVSPLEVDAPGAAPVSDAVPLEEGPTSVEDDAPESSGSTGDSAEEPESLGPLGDGSGSLGAIGARKVGGNWGKAAFATPAPAKTNPSPRLAANASRTTRCVVAT
jgi:hypothetical protein